MGLVVCMYAFDGPPVSRYSFQRMFGAVAGDRWREGCNIWAPEGRVALGACSLGLGSSDEWRNQPLTDSGGNYVLVADARIDNRGELSRELGLSPVDTDDIPDNTLILKAYERWGEDCPQHLLGDFVFAIWDKRRRQLFCARDHIGSRVLFYYLSGNFIVLASDHRALLAYSGVPRRLNRVKVAEFLVHIGGAEMTFYKDILRLPAGHRLIAKVTGVKVDRYWFPDNVSSVREHSDADYVEVFQDLFTKAVSDRLKGADSIGAFLSGGLDSSTVAATAATLLGRDRLELPTFTAIPPKDFKSDGKGNRYDDETCLVQEIASLHQNISPTFVRNDGDTPLDNLEVLFETLGAPVVNSENRLWMEAILRQASSRNISVMLHGQMGNLTISYDGMGLFPALVRKGRWLRLMREIGAMGAGGGRLWRSHVVGPFIPKAVLAGYRRRKGAQFVRPWLTYSAINPRFAQEIGIEDRFRQRNAIVHDVLPANGKIHRSRLLGSGFVLNAFDAFNSWRNRFGVEMRDPTADKRVVEFCLGIPETQYLRNGIDRYLTRRAMEGALPQSVLNGTRRGAQVPDWYQRLSLARNKIAKELDHLEGSDAATQCLDLVRMRRLVEAWPQENWNDPSIIVQYRHVLQRGIVLGRFIRWFEETQKM